jgi:hypothetical protein
LFSAGFAPFLGYTQVQPQVQPQASPGACRQTFPSAIPEGKIWFFRLSGGLKTKTMISRLCPPFKGVCF